MEIMSNTKKRLEKKVYMDAVWDYMLDHSDISPSGNLFIKFHTDNRRSFENHVIARVKGYHRNDPVEKEKKLELQKHIHKSEKSLLKEQKRKEKFQRILQAEEIKKEIKRVEKYNRRQRTFLGRIINKISLWQQSKI